MIFTFLQDVNMKFHLVHQWHREDYLILQRQHYIVVWASLQQLAIHSRMDPTFLH